MKIAIIIDLWSEGGGNIFLDKLKNKIREENHELEILTNDESLATEKIPFSEKGGIFRLLGIPRAKKSIEEKLNEKEPDVVLILSPVAALASTDIIFQNSNFKTIYAPRYLALEHWENIENMVTGKIKYTIEEISLRLNYDKILALTENMKTRIKKAGAESPIEIVPIGVNTEKFRPQDEKNDQKTVLFAGRFEPVKGIDLFLEASKKVENAKFVMVGDDKDKLEKVPSNVRVLGRVSHQKMVELYNQASMVAMPSYSEGLPRVGLEALSCGTPLVATNVGGIPDLINEGETGVLIDPGSVDQLTKGINKLLENPQLAEKMGKNGRELITEKYDEEKTMKKTLEAITELKS